MIAVAALLVLAIMLPASGVVLALAVGGRAAEWIAMAVIAGGAAIALAIAGTLWTTGAPLDYIIGGWPPPLGIALRADGVSAVMLLTSALVIGADRTVCPRLVRTALGLAAGRHGGRPLVFWTMLMGVWTGLNAVWLAGDLFTPVCRARTADLQRRAAGLAGGQARDAGRRAALHAVRADGLDPVPAWVRAALRRAMARWTSRCWRALARPEPVGVRRGGR